MTQETFDRLRTGDIVRGRTSGDAYVVMDHYGDAVVAVRTVVLTHPVEWDLVVRQPPLQEDAHA